MAVEVQNLFDSIDWVDIMIQCGISRISSDKDKSRWSVKKLGRNNVIISFKYNIDLKRFLSTAPGMARMFKKQIGGGPAEGPVGPVGISEGPVGTPEGPVGTPVRPKRKMLILQLLLPSNPLLKRQRCMDSKTSPKNDSVALGYGSSACVYRKKDDDDEDKVVKVFHDSAIALDLDVNEHNANQDVVRILKSNENTVILEKYDATKLDNSALAPRGTIMYSFCDGETLDSKLKVLEKEEDIFGLFDDVHETLSKLLKTLNDDGYYHCDLKPENIMICKINQKDIVTLIDFGIAGRTCTSGTPMYSRAEFALKVKTVVGNYYDRLSKETYDLIIENIKNEDIGKPYDMWALGLILLIILGKTCETTDKRYQIAINLMNPHAKLDLLNLLLEMKSSI